MAVLKLENIAYAYEKDKKIFYDVNMQMETGKLYAILGPSGCGKTTLLSLIGGMDSPTEGRILFDGEDIAKMGLANYRRQKVSFVFQSYNLIDYMTPGRECGIDSKAAAAFYAGTAGHNKGGSKKKCAEAFRRTAAANGNRTGFGKR